MNRRNRCPRSAGALRSQEAEDETEMDIHQGGASAMPKPAVLAALRARPADIGQTLTTLRAGLHTLNCELLRPVIGLNSFHSIVETPVSRSAAAEAARILAMHGEGMREAQTYGELQRQLGLNDAGMSRLFCCLAYRDRTTTPAHMMRQIDAMLQQRGMYQATA